MQPSASKVRRKKHNLRGDRKTMKLKRWVPLSVALLFAVAFYVSQLRAQTQTTGEITGIVTDPSGATVVKAKVVLKDNSKGTTLIAETNKDGVYHFRLWTPST